ncbi:MAG TPA: tetratricopeptide repeat protein [Streptosporangiaceae bacterium]|jgi:AAA+ superfamily predicted ATPase|nr:tetratricopeptide repeat protein [Streptosporangiaceae bacterium]
MEPDPTVLDSLRKAVDAMPDDVPLRLHLATMLLRAGRRDEAVRHLGAVLQRDPGHAQALGLLRDPGVGPAPDSAPAAGQPPAAPAGLHDFSAERSGVLPPVPGPPQPDPAHEPGKAPQYDWSQAEDELRDVLPAMFIGEGEADSVGIEEADAYDAEHAGLTLADVAGMTEVKQRLEAAFLAPMRNPDLRRLYGKSLRGGLLLYGPPGCGKTFIARAVAGELGAKFIAVSFADIIDMFVGQSERNIHELFEIARRNAPCVLFLDEVDAIGQKRSQLRHTPMRSAVNQLLLELDDVSGNNEGVFLLAATNHPWDVDSALRRPGRFDRTLLVLPPDAAAREGVFRYHLKDRPVAGIDLAKLAKQTDGYSGADIAHICETAAERALMDSVRLGEARMIGTPDLEAAIAEVKPSLASWFDVARNVALFANEGGSYDDLAAYLRKRRLL